MRKLLSVNFARLWRSLWFWLGAALMAWYAWDGICSVINMQRYGDVVSTLDYTVSYAELMLFALPIFATVFINTDYYYGTVRNKLAVGHSRVTVYLADLVLVWVVGLLYTLIYLLVNLGLGLPMVGAKQSGYLPTWVETLAKLGACLLVTAAIGAMSVLLARLVTHRTAPLVAIGVVCLLVISANFIDNALLAPKEVIGYDEIVGGVDENGQRTKMYRKDGIDYTYEDCPKELNPEYIGEPLRSVLVFYQNFNPAGQAIQLSRHRFSVLHELNVSPGTLAAFALGFSALAITAGLAVFQKKDLK